MHIINRLRRQDSGATAIEFAIVAPVLFLLLFGIIEFSLMMFVSSVVEGATATISRQSKTGVNRSTASTPAARAAEDSARLRQMVIDRGRGIIRTEYLDVATRPRTSRSGTVGDAGEMVIYTVSYDWHILTPLLSPILGDDDGVFPISSTTAVVNEPFES